MKFRLLACGVLAFLIACGRASSTAEVSISFAWSYHAGDYVRGIPAVGNGIVYIGADDNALHAVDADTGELIWRYETADNVTSSPAIYEDVVCFGSWDGSIYALDAKRGDVLWQYDTDGWVTASLAMRDGVVYVGSNDGFLYALSAEDGDLVWQTAQRPVNRKIEHQFVFYGAPGV